MALSVSATGRLAILQPLSPASAEREAFYRNELYKKLAESPADQAQRVLDLMREKDAAAERRRREGMKPGGLIVTAVGLGLMVMLQLLAPHDMAWPVGLIPLLIGLVLLFYVYVIVPKAGGPGAK